VARERLPTAVLISGRGSNLAALLAAARSSDYPAAIRLVVADRSDAGGLDHAKKFGVHCIAVEAAGFADKAEFETTLDRVLREFGIEVVCLAGFMRVLSAGFVDNWRNRILNIHPSLLPAFPGLRTHERAIAAGARLHGATVHVVSAAVDAGPILAQAAVPVRTDDTPMDLADRVLKVEHRLYPLALRIWASRPGRLIAAGQDLERGASLPS
jgi:phosphoribosylglycinamide formyltransferase-1